MLQINNDDLSAMRNELKRRLTPNEVSEFKTLIDLILEGPGYLINKFTRSSKRISLWYNIIILVLVTQLICLLPVMLLRPLNLPISTIFAGILFPTLGTTALLIYKINYRMIFFGLRDHILDAIELDADLVDLKRWLTGTAHVKPAILFSFFYGVLVGLPSLFVFSMPRGGLVVFKAGIVIAILSEIWTGVCIYYLILFLILPLRLGQYHFKLYFEDPSSSEVINRLSQMLINFGYLVAAVASLYTFFAASLRLLASGVIIVLIMTAWLPIVLTFLASHYALAKIITNAKWKALNTIQQKIDRLRRERDIVTTETLDTVLQLMDYHDRIKVTRNSALNIRAGLDFFNSLLLPVLGFLIGNLDAILKFLFP